MGIISKIYSWGQQGSAAFHLDTIDWSAFLIVVLIVSFLWTRVVRQTVSI